MGFKDGKMCVNQAQNIQTVALNKGRDVGQEKSGFLDGKRHVERQHTKVKCPACRGTAAVVAFREKGWEEKREWMLTILGAGYHTGPWIVARIGWSYTPPGGSNTLQTTFKIG